MKGLVGILVAGGAVALGLYAITGGHPTRALEGSRRRRRSGGFRGHAEQEELKVFIDNDGQLYRQMTTSIHKNLVTKIAKGVYDKTLAEKAWGHLVEAGAKKYAKDAGSGAAWHTMFSVADRREVARELNEEFLTEQKLGNFDHLLPKKYQRA